MLKLEVGKYYKNGNGSIFYIGGHVPRRDVYPYVGTSPDYEFPVSFTESGQLSLDQGKTKMDLVVEIRDPMQGVDPIPVTGLPDIGLLTPEEGVYLGADKMMPDPTAQRGQTRTVSLVDYSMEGRFPNPPEMCIDHLAVDTGMTNTWCKHCDINMEFNRDTGKYRVKV